MTSMRALESHLGAIKRTVSPFPSVDVPLAILLSPLDRVACQVGQTAVEDAFRNSAGGRVVTATLSRFLRDTRAELALKKAVHTAFENRLRIVALRTDPPRDHGFTDNTYVPTNNHPLDTHAARLLEERDPRIKKLRFRGTLAPRLVMLNAILIRCAMLVQEALFIYLRRGRDDVHAAAHRVGAPHRILDLDGLHLRRAAEEAGIWADGLLFSLIDSSVTLPRSTEWLSNTCVGTLVVDRARWRREALWPGMRLALSVGFGALRDLRDPWALQIAFECIVLAKESLAIRRIDHNFKFSYLLDNEEYSQRHILKAIILGANGTRVVHWPRSVADSPGAAISYLGYDIYTSSGPYLPNSFGGDWASHCRTVSVGMICNDRRVTATQTVKREYRRTINDHLAAAGKLIVYFLPSSIRNRDMIITATISAIVRQMRSRENWMLVIKPKNAGSEEQLDDILAANPGLVEPGSGDNLLVLRYGSDVVEVSPAGWLILRMHVGVGFSSVQIEAAVKGRPVLSYYPVLHRTPCTERLLEMGLAYEDPAAFECAVGHWMDNPKALENATDWFRINFDPFEDDQALMRLSNLLFGPPHSEAGPAT